MPQRRHELQSSKETRRLYPQQQRNQLDSVRRTQRNRHRVSIPNRLQYEAARYSLEQVCGDPGFSELEVQPVVPEAPAATSARARVISESYAQRTLSMFEDFQTSSSLNMEQCVQNGS